MHWQIAFRKKGERMFTLVPNPNYAWAADPFLVEYQGRILLFAELFLYKSERNGVLGYCEYKDGKFNKWNVTMDEHWHLSYPNVFVKSGKLLMCPESYQKHEVSIYELQKFPDKWRRVETIFSNVEYVDTTFVHNDGKNYIFTFEPTFKDDGGRLLLYRQNKDGVYSIVSTVTEDKSKARPGGNFVKKSGKVYRISQNCLRSYGEGLVISEVDAFEPVYQEHAIRCIMPHDIKLNDTKEILGVHTYNQLGDLEVIDIKYYNPTLQEAIAAKRTKGVFCNKYGKGVK